MDKVIRFYNFDQWTNKMLLEHLKICKKSLKTREDLVAEKLQELEAVEQELELRNVPYER